MVRVGQVRVVVDERRVGVQVRVRLAPGIVAVPVAVLLRDRRARSEERRGQEAGRSGASHCHHRTTSIAAMLDALSRAASLGLEMERE